MRDYNLELINLHDSHTLGCTTTPTTTTRDKDEVWKVNKREIHEYDGRAHDPDTMVALLTPKPTLKTKFLTRETSTIVSSHQEDAALRK